MIDAPPVIVEDDGADDAGHGDGDDDAGHGDGRARARPADATVRIHRGRLCFYRKYSNFEAVCGNPAHGCCIVRRTPLKRRDGPDGKPRGGRPCGFLAGFLSLSWTTGTREEHKTRMLELLEPQAVRARHREALQPLAGSDALLSFERVPVVGEPVEQVDLIGLK